MSNHSDKKKEELKRLVIDAILEELQKSSSEEHEDLRAISKGLEEGRKLELAILTGGLCNYSYKLHFENYDDKSDVAVFVKLTFGKLLNFPDVPCSPDRSKYEFKMMELFAKISPHPESAVTPYLFLELEGSDENMKVIVSQYSSRLEEQAANIFIDGGTIDKTFATNLANEISSLHNAEVTEPDFNKGMKEFFMKLTSVNRMILDGYLDEANEQPDRAVTRARAIGKEGLDRIMKVYCEQLTRTDCYVHGDCHAFNMLVQGNLNVEDCSSNGDVTLIDWEFSHCGPLGMDLGRAYCFPVACIFAHAINGDESSSKSVLDFLDTLWETYSASINLDGKDLSLVDVYRQVMGFMAVCVSTYSAMGLNMNYIPIDENRTEDLAKVAESLGVLALEAFEIGFLGVAEDATLGELRKRFQDAVAKELDQLKPSEKRTIRRQSLLRKTGRRVSDAHSYFSLASDVADELGNLESEDELGDLPLGEFTYDQCAVYSPPLRMRDALRGGNGRTSLALVDLKRKSLTDWDKMIVDFDF